MRKIGKIEVETMSEEHEVELVPDSHAASTAPTENTAATDAERSTEDAVPRTGQRSLLGWGRVAHVFARELCSENLEEISKQAVLSRGLGRSYGDASLPAPEFGPALSTRFADRILDFDSETGVLRAEAGLSLRDLLHSFLSSGFFVPVTPGTQFATLGGCVASDVHGKNHHRDGSFGEHLRSLKMRVADGRILVCSPDHEAELFYATLGGMGLTGHILEVELQMARVPSPWIWQKVKHFDNLESLFVALRSGSAKWPFSVAWIDGLTAPGREHGILMLGRWAEADEAPRKFPKPRKARTVPFDAPSWFLNGLTGRIHNRLHSWTHRNSVGIEHPETFFYPLDHVRDWNRLYGKRGFIQYQCILPHEEEGYAVLRFLDLLRKLGADPLLCVLKDFGAQGKGMLSFPKPGFTLCIDLPYRGDRTQNLVDQLNEFVLAEEGRIYLAKDLHTRAEHFFAMEPRFEAWNEVRRRWDPQASIRSALSVRLFGDDA